MFRHVRCDHVSFEEVTRHQKDSVPIGSGVISTKKSQKHTLTALPQGGR